MLSTQAASPDSVQSKAQCSPILAEAPSGLEDHDRPSFYQGQPDIELPRTEKEQQC